jgi:hypothetical protein
MLNAKVSQISTLDALVFGLIALCGIGFGALLIESAFEGAGMLPHLMLRVGVQYSAQTAITQFVFGQALVAVSIGGIFLIWKDKRSDS